MRVKSVVLAVCQFTSGLPRQADVFRVRRQVSKVPRPLSDAPNSGLKYHHGHIGYSYFSMELMVTKRYTALNLKY